MAVIQCPTCQKEYRWKPELAGKRVKCKCGQIIGVPVDEPAVEANDLYDLVDGPGDPLQHGLADLQAAAALAPVATEDGNQFRCPYCGENVDPSAAMCVFCGSKFQGAVSPAARRPIPSALQSAPPASGRAVRMRAPSAEDNAGRTRLIIFAVVGVLILGGAIFGLKHFSKKPPALDPNLQPGDRAILTKIDEQGGSEARDWLNANEVHNLMGFSKKQALYRVDQWYAMGAKRVMAFSSGTSTSVALELPDDPAKRKAIFDWQKQWHGDMHQKIETDTGQKWLEIAMRL